MEVIDSKTYQKYRDNDALPQMFEQYGEIVVVRWDSNDISLKIQRKRRIDGEMQHFGVSHRNNITKEQLFGE